MVLTKTKNKIFLKKQQTKLTRKNEKKQKKKQKKKQEKAKNNCLEQLQAFMLI